MTIDALAEAIGALTCMYARRQVDDDVVHARRKMRAKKPAKSTREVPSIISKEPKKKTGPLRGRSVT
ncbi:hypothetical protein [Pseudoxanthomonas sp. X-1]|uniref:hypothetical protein n=1 Tax=Pseudoxanthomonas sp. X-1 TaxID=2571115 RepID=UPI00110AB5A8|nr:hypothetical protein [Pseudoxanthomonas sp. X-1]TMN17157.1 hypothetical protein FF950_17535 [Pseudoxanthomonas sp. X-1]UAY76177.1 hypothetical protein LAJ50_08085 [Pseudoxanthomonas sp. X-1]